MDCEKSPEDTVHRESLAVEAQSNAHTRTKWQAAKQQPLALAWIGWALFVLCLQGFDATAGSTVVGIQQFRKDFGRPYRENYVLHAQWQSAFTGGPSAMAVIGALSSSYIRDSEYVCLPGSGVY
jgi:SP family general alpha glucoside:H+ symporter-like MFS transporter